MGIRTFGFILLFFLAGLNCIAQEHRTFTMALWNNPSGADADIAFFNEGQPQPQGHSVLLLTSWRRDQFADYWLQSVAPEYDLQRIEAVLVDEPYWSTAGTPDWSNPCRDARKSLIDDDALRLTEVAAVIKTTSPNIRFWINFSEPEMRWMMDRQCPAALSGEYIDVVSLDIYWKPFSTGLKRYYDWLLKHRYDGQQVALVPGTFFRSDLDSPITQASLLRGFFDYANRLNHACGQHRRGAGGGKGDKCPVWIVAGWLATSVIDSHGCSWHGEADPASWPIRAAWENELAKPLSQKHK